MLKFEGIDLFCGAGGTTTGIEKARRNKQKIADVIACINHDPVAIESHLSNHKNVVHFTEDIKTFDVHRFPKFTDSTETVTYLWASLECTNFSNAKGGLPRDADSRTLAEHLYRYIEHVKPDYILIENVREFMAWGALDENGKPESRDRGRSYMRWVKKIKSYGYNYEYRILNAADYGAYTSRRRLFILFSKEGCPVAWPVVTHCKSAPGAGNMFGLKKWKAVKDVLDFKDEGASIFTRKKELSEKTKERIYAGLVKYVANGDESFITRYFTGDPNHHNKDVNSPLGSVTTVDHHAMVNVKKAFLQQYNSGNDYTRVLSVKGPTNTVTTANRFGLVQAQFLINYNHRSKTASVDEPSPTLLTKDKYGYVSPEFLIKYHGNGKNTVSVDEPASTLSTKDRLAIIHPKFFIDIMNTQGKKNDSVERPLGSILTVNKYNLVKAEQSFIMQDQFNNKGSSINEPAPTLLASRHNHYLLNPQYADKGKSVDDPCFTLIARMDKKPPYLVSTEKGEAAIEIYETDSPATVKIKLFMAAHGIIDIKMRMLKIPELLRIQGFPRNYVLCGTQADRKKFIGNAVVPVIPKKWIEALYGVNLKLQKIKKAA
jgi:DNA (cytosine-5)-methyltransferase 1